MDIKEEILSSGSLKQLIYEQEMRPKHRAVFENEVSQFISDAIDKVVKSCPVKEVEKPIGDTDRGWNAAVSKVAEWQQSILNNIKHRL